jgi:hypothetical protein
LDCDPLVGNILLAAELTDASAVQALGDLSLEGVAARTRGATSAAASCILLGDGDILELTHG